MTISYDEILALLRNRRSIRRFQARPLPQDTAQQLVEAARWAPCASNHQPYRFIAISSGAVLSQMVQVVLEQAAVIEDGVRAEFKEAARAYSAKFVHFGQAPLVLVATCREGIDMLTAAGSTVDRSRARRLTGDTSLASTAAAIQNLLLAAHALGLGACWMTGPLIAHDQLVALLEVQSGWRVSALIAVGYPDEEPAAPPRRELHQLLRKIE